MYSRRISFVDETGEGHETFWCDSSMCSDCKLRFQCYTDKSYTLEVVVPKEEMIAKVREMKERRWRLRDGSSEFRKILDGR